MYPNGAIGGALTSNPLVLGVELCEVKGQIRSIKRARLRKPNEWHRVHSCPPTVWPNTHYRSRTARAQHCRITNLHYRCRSTDNPQRGVIGLVLYLSDSAQREAVSMLQWRMEQFCRREG